MKIAVSLEGVLSDASHRQELRNESFYDYQAAVSDDAPNLKLVSFLKYWGEEVVVYSTTPDNLRPAITQWLLDHDIEVDDLLLKKKNDYRPEWEIKFDMIKSLDAECEVVIENSTKVADLLRSEGYLVLQT